MAIGWIIGGAIVVVGVLYVVLAYNGLVQLRNRIQNAASQIDVQLKRRYDLIPNLMETVKGYAKHEKEVFMGVTQARTALMNAHSMGEKAKASDMIENALKSLFAVAENYPTLKANENFMMLQEELSGTENKIAYSRQFYNDTVLDYNNKIQMFPTSIIAGMFNFGKIEFFATKAEEKEPIKVKF